MMMYVEARARASRSIITKTKAKIIENYLFKTDTTIL